MWSMPDATSWRHSSLVTCRDKSRWLRKSHSHVIVQVPTRQRLRTEHQSDRTAGFAKPPTPAKLLQVRRGMLSCLVEQAYVCRANTSEPTETRIRLCIIVREALVRHPC